MRYQRRLAAVILIALPCIVGAGEDPRTTPTNDLRSLIHDLAEQDGDLSLSVEELASAFGTHDRVDPRGNNWDLETQIFLMSEGRELQVVADKKRVYWVAVVSELGEWEQLWK